MRHRDSEGKMTDRCTDRQGEIQTRIQRWREKAETERWRQIETDRWRETQAAIQNEGCRQADR